MLYTHTHEKKNQCKHFQLDVNAKKVLAAQTARVGN